ncbi:YARHG domain-containing protein [Saprospira grandis]|uniref:YARHG domain-containing protein n=1 Tax=Saprospira grandis (strain Lewin) TaxID=984262 RepID=H6L6V2_SAPGL|nr:YARHG domain-containing protein [Saprospira grandis]AFC26382.1 hypothetical protein SGRA_3661 [Saprospira grandis str. Lewin]
MYKKMIPLAFLGLFLVSCAGEAEKAAASSENPMKTETAADPYADLEAPKPPQTEQRPKVQHKAVGQHYSVAYASTEDNYYFFDDGRFVYASSSEYSPSILTGDWTAEGPKISFKNVVHYYGKPTGKMIPPCGSVCTYDDYGMRVEKYSQDIDPIDIDMGLGDEFPFNVSPHGLKSSDIHAFLRAADSKRSYLEVSERPLQPSELKDKTAEELRLMRNEVFAAYGYKFKDEALKKHFRNQGFYGHSSDVNAFLSPLEKDNIALIKKVEAIKKK